tara:strand:- start:9598 stop:9786 length:189 start_codon:yes stop_codon:yes gene_type:complete
MEYLNQLSRWIQSKTSMVYQRQLFLDIVSGKYVNEYKDCFGTLYMANSPYGFRTLKGIQINK